MTYIQFFEKRDRKSKILEPITGSFFSKKLFSMKINPSFPTRETPQKHTTGPN
jgi:hypothetical protein